MSCCWGKKQPALVRHLMTRESLDNRCKRIELRILRQTLKDAVVTTRALGCSYLGIDGSMRALHPSRCSSNAENWQNRVCTDGRSLP